MESLKTCPACGYTRKPTDDAPEWACPHCNKVYKKMNKLMGDPGVLTAAGRTGNGFSLTTADIPHCKYHPEEKATWRCVDCGAEFCSSCVTPIPCPSIQTISIPIASCPECHRMCIDFTAAQRLEIQRQEKEKDNRNRQLKTLLTAIAGTILFFIVTAFLPLELRFLSYSGL